MFTKSNPFVKDDMYFANRSHYVYSETTWYSIQTTYNVICSSLGILLASLIFYLLTAQTPPSLKSYRKMLLLVTIVDLFVLINCVGIYFRLRITNDALLVALSGFYTSLFSYRQLCPVMCMYMVTGSIGISVLPVQYFYRYYTLEKDKPPPTYLIIFAFCLAVTPCALVSPKTSPIYCPSDDSNPLGIDYGPLWFEELPIPPLFVELPSEKSLWFYSNNVLTIIFYSIAVIYGVLTVRTLRQKLSLVMFSKAVKSVERQLTRTMIAQSCLPLITLILPQCIHQFVVYLNVSNDTFAVFTKQSLTLVPIFNMLACIIFIKPYRKFCLRPIQHVRPFNGACHTSVVPIGSAMDSRIPSSTS